MPNPGKYVRAPAYESDEENSYEEERNQSTSPGKFVRISNLDENNIDRVAEVQDDIYIDYQTEIDPERENRELRGRVLELEKIIAEISGSRTRNGEDNHYLEAVRSQSSSSEAPALVQPSTSAATRFDSSTQSVRWDNIKPFPKGIPANKLWEAWTKYFENFEIAASLSNVCDPVKRFQLLYLSVGDELQGIVRAAKLRPESIDASCYGDFVKNIEKYLKALTDTSAEHDMFSSMQQEKGESAVNFHARLVK